MLGDHKTSKPKNMKKIKCKIVNYNRIYTILYAFCTVSDKLEIVPL